MRKQGPRTDRAAAVSIRRFTPADQRAAEQLVVAGLVEHWGAADEALNPDLDDIAASYAGGVFLVVESDGVVIGTGVLIPRAHGEAEIVRMSIVPAWRRKGIASRVLRELLAEARRRGATRIVLETSADWRDVVAFYVANGFTITHDADGPFGLETWLALELAR